MFCIWSILLLPNYKVKSHGCGDTYLLYSCVLLVLCCTCILYSDCCFLSWQRRGPVRWWCRKRRFPEMWVCDSVDFISAQQAWQKHLLMVSLCPAWKDVPHRWLLCNWNDRRQSKQSKQWRVDIVLDYLLVLCLTSQQGYSFEAHLYNINISFLSFLSFCFLWLSIVFSRPLYHIRLPCYFCLGFWIPDFMLFTFVLHLTCWVMNCWHFCPNW